jgi:signal peptidase I
VGARTGRADNYVEDVAPPPKGVIRDYAETILVCVIFVIFTRAFVFQQSKIPSGSMEDTLLVGDYILVNRFVYAPAASEWERKLLPVREIERGDVIVFKFPDAPEVDYIKRVIGLPGDSLEIKGSEVWVNGVRLDEPYVPEKYHSRDMRPPEVVPPDSYFCMGDHRNLSMDSRTWGFVPRSLVKGRALLIWWSYPDERDALTKRGFDQLKAMGKKIATFAWRSRWSRCFTLIR